MFEVDEAATRIREEVDKDANIIVGATFDESLDGIVRVSVVATGIDKIAAARPLPAPAADPRAPMRSPEKVERAMTPPSRIPAHAASAIEQAATAAVAAAVLAADGDRGRHHPLDAAEAFAVHGSEHGSRRGRIGYHHPIAPDMPNTFIPPRPS